MIPLKDNVSATKFPFFMWLIIAINCYVYYLQVTMGEGRLQGFIDQYAVHPSMISAWWSDAGTIKLGEVLFPLVSSMFLHGSFMHILGNMWVLMIFGDNVEDYLGHFKFLCLYLLGGIFAAVSHVLALPSSELPTLGASGAIAAVMGAYFVFFPRATVRTLIPLGFRGVIVNIQAWIFLVLWFGIQIFSGLMEDTAGVAWWAHAGGFFVGTLGALLFRRRDV